jgi:hypothetical protein
VVILSVIPPVRTRPDHTALNTAREDLVVVEVSASYNGGPWQYGVQLLEFRDDKVARERIYVTEGWEAPEWRAPWRSDTPADPPE